MLNIQQQDVAMDRDDAKVRDAEGQLPMHPNHKRGFHELQLFSEEEVRHVRRQNDVQVQKANEVVFPRRGLSCVRAEMKGVNNPIFVF